MVAKVDAVKTFDDVLTLAKEMLDWQKEQVEQMTKLPDFDNISVIKNYELADDEDDFEDEEMRLNGQGDNSDAEQNDDDADEKNDFNNFGDEKAMMKKTLIKMVKGLNQMTILKKKKKTKVSNSSC